MFFPSRYQHSHHTATAVCPQLLKSCHWPQGLPRLVDFFLSSNLHVSILRFWKCCCVGEGEEVKTGKRPRALASSLEDGVCCCTWHKQLLFLALNCVSTLLLSLSLLIQGVWLCDKESLMRFMWPGEDMCCENCLPSTECQEGPQCGCQDTFILTENGREGQRRKISI